MLTLTITGLVAAHAIRAEAGAALEVLLTWRAGISPWLARPGDIAERRADTVAVTSTAG